MRLYFFRHGQADWPHRNDSDDNRPLNKRGAKETRRMAKFLRCLGIKPGLLMTSPLPRASQTAEIAAEEFQAPLVEEAALSPGCDVAKLRAILKKHPGQEEVMLFGHEPDLSTILKALTGSRLKISKSGVARVDLDAKLTGKLVWLFPPKIAD
ncbi:MAG: phosphohistidine phosphatase SixA [Verrucomicrobia bacterium]|nr:phosphohistidine phosphatase SixA [Verrucomicrobiota bacterium]